MARPQVPEQPVPVLAEDDLKKLMADCAGPAFEDRRDQALIRLLVDTGMRRGELLGMRVEDLDLDQQVAFVLGKGRRERGLPARTQDGAGPGPLPAGAGPAPARDIPWLWIQRRGRLNESGIATMLKRRGTGRHRDDPSPSAPPHLCPCLAVSGR